MGGCKDSKQIRTNYAQVFRESRAVAPQGGEGVLGFQVWSAFFLLQTNPVIDPEKKLKKAPFCECCECFICDSATSEIQPLHFFSWLNQKEFLFLLCLFL